MADHTLEVFPKGRVTAFVRQAYADVTHRLAANIWPDTRIETEYVGQILEVVSRLMGCRIAIDLSPRQSRFWTVETLAAWICVNQTYFAPISLYSDESSPLRPL